MHGWVRCENDLQREVNFFRKNSARPEDRRRAHHRYTRGEGAGCVHNLGVNALAGKLLSRNPQMLSDYVLFGCPAKDASQWFIGSRFEIAHDLSQAKTPPLTYPEKVSSASIWRIIRPSKPQCREKGYRSSERPVRITRPPQCIIDFRFPRLLAYPGRWPQLSPERLNKTLRSPFRAKSYALEYGRGQLSERGTREIWHKCKSTILKESRPAKLVCDLLANGAHVKMIESYDPLR